MDKNPKTAQWLRYLMYASIVSIVEYLLNFIGLSGLIRWISPVVNGVTVYLLFMLAGVNVRYKYAAGFYAAALVGGLIGGTGLSLVASVCGIVAQYQEYHAHGELIGEKEPKLADKWNTLFGLEIVVTLVGALLGGLVVGILTASLNIDENTMALMITVLVAVLGLGLKLLYLNYLKKTIGLVDTETVM